MKLVKIVAEIRFEQSVLFDDARIRNDIVKHLKPKFSGFDYNEEMKGLVFFFVKDDHKKLVIVQKDKVVVDIDEPTSIDQIKTEGNDAFPFVLHRLDVSMVQRIGVRAQYIDDSIEVPEIASQRISRSFFKQELLDFIGVENLADDIAPHIGFTKPYNHEIKITTNIAYRQVGEAIMNPGSGGVKLTNIQKVYPLIDLDIYTEVPKKIDQINGLLKAASSIFEDHARKVWE